MFLHNLKKKSKHYFVSGLLFIVPLVITILVIKSLFVFLDNLLFPYLKPYFSYWVPGIGIVLIIIIILITGVLVTNYIGRYIISRGEKILYKIPIAKSLYTSVKQIIETFSFKDEDKESYKKVVLVEYPKEGIWSVGIVNGECNHPVSKEILFNILIIAAINPVSGFFILVPKTKVVSVDLSLEEAMKWIVSGGIITPPSLKTK
jgi:uncharacterized membrane protein